MIAPFQIVQALAADWIYVQYPAFLAQFHTFLPPFDRQAGQCRSTDTPPFATGPETAACSTSTSQRVPNHSYRPWFRCHVVWAMAKTNERHRPHGFAYALKGVCPPQVSPFASFSFVLPFYHYTLLTHLPCGSKHSHSSNRGVIIMIAVLIR